MTFINNSDRQGQKMAVMYMPDRQIPLLAIDHQNNTQELRGHMDDFFYYFSIIPTDLYFFKSKTPYQKDAVKMSRSDIMYLLEKVKNYIHPQNVYQIDIIRFAWEQQCLSEDKKQASLLPESQPIARHNNLQSDLRKVRQAEKLLNKYVSIPPVIVYDKNHQPISACAKLDGRLVYISLDEKKPAFWFVSLTQATPMNINDIMNFMEYTGESPTFEKTCERLAQLYQKFQKANSLSPNRNTANALYCFVRNTLVNHWDSFSHTERTLCLTGKNRQRTS